jgi:hypothetical protein
MPSCDTIAKPSILVGRAGIIDPELRAHLYRRGRVAQPAA